LATINSGNIYEGIESYCKLKNIQIYWSKYYFVTIMIYPIIGTVSGALFFYLGLKIDQK
jgi:hypothetical protein